MTIVEFNQGAEFTTGLLDEFAASGNPLVDELWRKPAGSIGQRDAIAIGLFERLLAGPGSPIRARIHQAIRTLLRRWKIDVPFYQRRRLRGDSIVWADTVAALLIRMPVARVVHRKGPYGSARPIIATALQELLLSSHVQGLDYERPLAAKMPLIVDVVIWFARNDPGAKADVGMAMSPLMQYLWDRRQDGRLTGDARESIQQLYALLDATLDVCEDTQGAWPSIHEYCLKALGIDKQDSAVWRLQDDMPGLVNAFKASLSRRIGPDLAETLLSDRYLDPAALGRAQNVTDVLLRLLRARESWAGTVGLGRENSYDLLHRELNECVNWRNLNDIIRAVASEDAPASDEQMAELVNLLPGPGNIIAEQVVPRALQRIRTPGYPLTRQALEDLPVTGDMAVTPFFDETLAMVRQGLRSA